MSRFMQSINESESTGFIRPDQFSVTEKAIKNACEIAVALDPSNDVPYMEGWPISKIAVLLVDEKKENFYLQSGSVTEGVWSLIEKSIDKSIINEEKSTETEYLQLACDAVKDATGFDKSELFLMDTRVAYSLSKLKSSNQLYIMRCSKSFSEKYQFPLQFLVDSLQGPLVENSDSFWRPTPVFEYLHMLPYFEFISSWISKKDMIGCNDEKAVLDLLAFNDNDKHLEYIDDNTPVTKVNSIECSRKHKRPKISSDDGKCQNDPLSGPSKGIQEISFTERTKTRPKIKEKNKRNNFSCVKACRENDDETNSCDQNNADFANEANYKYDIQVQNVQASEEAQNALALLRRKRKELWAQFCTMEDTLASYEDNIERISEGGEVGLARQCTTSILSGNSHSLPGHELENRENDQNPGKKKKRISDIYFPGKSSFQDLECMCERNSWRLPRYNVESSDGKFLSNVLVRCKDFEISLKGGLGSNPNEARESAAAHAIAKIREDFA